MIPSLNRFLVCILLAGAFAASTCDRMREQVVEDRQPESARPPSPDVKAEDLFFGNPSNANRDEADNFLLVGKGSVIAYNNSRGTANWIYWRTTRADLGPSLRRPDFSPDPRLPDWFNHITYSDYSGSGYDRGHLVPSADRFGNRELNEETFLMTNIVPQTAALNQYPWEKLESYARGQARRGFEVHQIAGVYGTKEILRGGVAVPTNCWKIIAINRGGDRTPDRRTRILAVDMPNVDGIENVGWETFRTTIRAIEEKTGYDLFRSLPSELQDQLESTLVMASP